MPKATFSELRLEGVTRAFAKSVALSDLSLTVKNGEFVALLGPSGCGKSTALNCLAGLLPLSAGTISLDDRRVDTLAPERRGFGMVFQNYALFPHLSVRRNVAFGLQMHKTPKAEIARRVDAALNLVQLSAHGNKHPSQLSGGQQQRVAIARAVVMEPQVVLMDEPLSNLDAKLRHEMRGEMQRLHRELGLTTVYVTHDQEEALSLADRLVVLHDGRVQQIGKPEEVYLRPVNTFVADFMGYRNLLAMTADGEGAGGDLHVSGLGMSLTARHPIAADARGAVTVAIRPDDLVVGEVEGNRIDVLVQSVEYLGKDFELEVQTEQGARLFLRTSEHLSIGQRVTIGVRPDRVMVYS
ncbi:MAG: spermidine/putrescine transporter ATPase [Leifsonia sp.]|nr:spermidine/putrescine transporter ATPase [Leifsonia sp.]